MDPLIQKCDDVARLLKDLSHPQRLKMLCHMGESPKSVTELTELCGASQSQVSQFLRQMRSDGLVSPTRDGKYVYYAISNPDVAQLIKAMRRIFDT